MGRPLMRALVHVVLRVQQQVQRRQGSVVNIVFKLAAVPSEQTGWMNVHVHEFHYLTCHGYQYASYVKYAWVHGLPKEGPGQERNEDKKCLSSVAGVTPLW